MTLSIVLHNHTSGVKWLNEVYAKAELNLHASFCHGDGDGGHFGAQHRSIDFHCAKKNGRRGSCQAVAML